MAILWERAEAPHRAAEGEWSIQAAQRYPAFASAVFAWRRHARAAA